MNTRSLRRSSTAALLLAPLLVLGACGDDGSPSVSEPTQSSPTEEAADETETPEETETETETPEETETETETPEETETETPEETETDTEAPETGSTDSAADEEEVATVVETYFDAMGDKDGEAVCELMSNLDNSGPLADQPSMLEGCAEGVASGFGGLDDAQAEQMRAVEVSGAEIDGDTAVVRPEHLEGSGVDTAAQVELPLIKIDGTWYIDSAAVSGM